ncbi:MAG: hypothetical protein AAGA12_13865 [Pseudomonadota bacterium]
MDRRLFTQGAVLSGLAAPAIVGPSSVWSKQLSEDDAKIAEFAPITLRLAAQVVVLQWLIVNVGNSFVAMKIAGDQRQYSERRSRLGGLLGGLARPTVEDRLKNATLLGGLFLVRNSLVLLPNSAIDYQKLEFIIYHRYLSWDVDAAFRVANLGNLNADQIRAQSDPIGAAMLTSAVVALLISPVLGKVY